jgi:hypothetical protein
MIVCSGPCGQRIRKGNWFYCTKDGACVWCQKCYAGLHSVLPAHSSFSRGESSRYGAGDGASVAGDPNDDDDDGASLGTAGSDAAAAPDAASPPPQGSPGWGGGGPPPSRPPP